MRMSFFSPSPTTKKSGLGGSFGSEQNKFDYLSLLNNTPTPTELKKNKNKTTKNNGPNVHFVGIPNKQNHQIGGFDSASPGGQLSRSLNNKQQHQIGLDKPTDYQWEHQHRLLLSKSLNSTSNLPAYFAPLNPTTPPAATGIRALNHSSLSDSFRHHHHHQATPNQNGNSTPSSGLRKQAQEQQNISSSPLNTHKNNRTTPAPSTPQQQPLIRQNIGNSNKTSKIPITMNPNVAQAGLRLGRQRLIQRIRLNLISLILSYIITHTKLYSSVSSSLAVLTLFRSTKHMDFNHNSDLINHLSSLFPSSSTPIQVIEWTITLLFLANLIEAYYRLKTQQPITHIELPLTPQQIRGSCQPTRNESRQSSPSVFGVHSTSSPLQRYQFAKPNKSTTTSFDAFSPKSLNQTIVQKETILKDSYNHNPLFKRSSNQQQLNNSINLIDFSNKNNELSKSFGRPSNLNHSAFRFDQSIRKISNPRNLKKLIEENIGHSSL